MGRDIAIDTPAGKVDAWRADPEGAPLATESGRIMLASKRVAEAGLEVGWMDGVAGAVFIAFGVKLALTETPVP